jgi:biofilm PGA synthesis protein PgaA
MLPRVSPFRRHHGAIRSAIGVLLFACLTCSNGAAQAVVPAAGSREEAHERAVLAARDGRLDEGIAALRELFSRDPADVAVAGDLAVVLSWAERHSEALEVARALPPGAAPPYVLRALGESLLALDRPRQAADLYRRILESEPEAAETRMALFWAEIEAERFGEAFRVIDEMAVSAPSGRPKVSAERTASMARALGDRLAEAQSRLERLSHRQPDDPDILLSLSTVYRWRGWPEQALATVDRVVAGHPGLASALVARTRALMDLGRLEEAGALVRRLVAEHPDDREVPPLQEAWRLRHRPELTLEVSAGESSGDTFGASDRRSEVLVYGSVLANRFRPFLHAGTESAQLAEGELSWDRLGAGLEMSSSRFRLIGQVSGNRSSEGGDAALGAALDLGWRFGDHWFAGARVDSDSPDVPLRGRPYGIDGRSARLALRWTGSDLASVRGSFSRLELSDGNLRQSLLLAAEHRFLTRPRLRLTGSAELYGSVNRLAEVPYFNPERDVSATGALAVDVLTWRSRGRSLTQRLALAGGAYEQTGFGSAPVGSVRYEHTWRLPRAFDLRYGVGWSSRVYDGGREERTWGYFSTGLRL